MMGPASRFRIFLVLRKARFMKCTRKVMSLLCSTVLKWRDGIWEGDKLQASRRQSATRTVPTSTAVGLSFFLLIGCTGANVYKVPYSK